MSKTKEKHGEQPHEERSKSMSFDFFRRHQKFILYTAGIFALLSFSITGALLGFTDVVFRNEGKLPTMELPDGRVIKVTMEDEQVGRLLANSRELPAIVLPSISSGQRDESLAEMLAALRRLCIAYGVDASDDDVGRAIEQARSVAAGPGGDLTAAGLARTLGFSSLSAYELVVREALRIGIMVRLLALGVDTSDHELAGEVLRDLEIVTLRVAVIDAKAIEEELRKTDVSDEDLRAWVDGLADGDQIPYRDTNRVALKLAALRFGDFKPDGWAAELEGKEPTEQELQNRYSLDRELLYRRPESGDGDGKKEENQDGQEQPTSPYVPFEEVKDAIRTKLQAEEVLRAVWAEVQLALAAHVRPAVDARTAALRVLAEKKEATAAAEAALRASPDDAELKDKAEQAKAEQEQAQAAFDAAEAEVAAARASFDLEVALADARDRGVVVVAVAPPRNADGLREPGEGLGVWENSFTATSMENVGDLSTRIQTTAEACFFFQVTAIEKSPLKDFADIRDTLREDYYKKKAQEQAEAKAKAFEETLDRLSREAQKEAIEAIKKELADKVTEAFDEWKAKVEADKAEAERYLGQLAGVPDSQAYKSWKARLDDLDKQLADPAAKRGEIEEGLRASTDEEIAAKAREAVPDVFEAAVAEVGVAVRDVGPHPRDVDMEPRFEEEYPEDVRFLFRNAEVKKLEEGEATGLLEDASGRAWYVAVCKQVGKGTMEHVSRRRFEAARTAFEAERRTGAVQQSFSLDALKERFNYWSPAEVAKATPPNATPPKAPPPKAPPPKDK